MFKNSEGLNQRFFNGMEKMHRLNTLSNQQYHKTKIDQDCIYKLCVIYDILMDLGSILLLTKSIASAANLRPSFNPSSTASL